MVKSNVNKVKSCTGCLYYSSHFKANSRHPLCLGLTRSLPPNVTGYDVGQSDERRGIYNKENYSYVCVGYSLFYVDRKRDHPKGQHTQSELPACVVGVEFIRSVRTTHIHNKQDSNGLPQRHLPRPTNSNGEDFLSRFTRNANVVANGMAKNMHRIGNRIKQSLDDALSLYRKRPK